MCPFSNFKIIKIISLYVSCKQQAILHNVDMVDVYPEAFSFAG